MNSTTPNSQAACCASDESDYNQADGHNHEAGSIDFKIYIPAIFSFVLLLIGIGLDYFDTSTSLSTSFFTGWVRLSWYIVAYIPVGLPVLKEGWISITKGDFFTEFLLMSIATIGAFAIGEYPEGVAVMLFYTVGELFQGAAVQKAKGNIKALLDVRPNEALVLRKGDFISVPPETVTVGETVQVRVGEKIPLDGVLLSEKASVNTAALTGESKPSSIKKRRERFCRKHQSGRCY